MNRFRFGSGGVWAAALAVLTAAVPGALGAWPDDPAVNLAIADNAGGQVVPHLAAAGDGGVYVSWYDGPAGYDVRLQRLDGLGNELWPHNGVLVADTDFSSVQDYALAVDGSDNALLAYLDSAGGNDQVFAQLVSPAGDLLWGASGVQLTTGAAFHGKPEAAALAGGLHAIAWIDEDATVVQALDDTGAPQWGAGVTLTDPAGGSLMAADLRATEDGQVIVSLVEYVLFSGPKHLLAQKLDAAGALQWGADPVVVFEAGSLQFGNFPDFSTDGSGGAVFSWYDTYGTILQCYVQHLGANGAEIFPHNGVPVSTVTSRQRVGPAAVLNQTTGEIFAFWVEEDMLQGQHGLYGQKISAAGTRQWTDSGLVIAAVDDQENSQVNALASGDGATVYYMERPSSASYQLRAARLDGLGGAVWNPPVIDVATAAAGKEDLGAALSAWGPALLVWTDGRNDDGDIFGQNVNQDGTLGAGDTPTPGPTATPTVPPSPTEEPTATVTPEASATPEPTLTPGPELGVRIELPAMVHPGEEFQVAGFLDNPGPELELVPVFFVLDVYANYWFWPAWSRFEPPSTGISYDIRDVPAGTTEIEVVPAFVWPDTGDEEALNLLFWGAMLNQGLTEVVGSVAAVNWGYGPR